MIPHIGTIRTVLTFALLLCLATACGSDATDTAGTSGNNPGAQPASGDTAPRKLPPKPVSTKARQEADQVWQILCVNCHGNAGKGDGPGSAALDPKPRSFGDQEWQASVTDEHIMKVIVEGGAGVGKSPLMVPNPMLRGKTEVLQLLLEKVRSFGK